MLSIESHINLTRNGLFRSIPHIYPDIDRVIVLSTTAQGNVAGLELLRENGRYCEKKLYADGLQELFAPEKERVVFSWILKDQLPFEEKRKQNGQLNLFSEREHIVLMVKITSETAENTVVDIFYLFFRENQSNFGISRMKDVFDTSLKAIVGSQLSKFIVVYYDDVNKIHSKFSEFTNVTSKLFEYACLQKDTSPLREMMQQWADDFLENCERPSGVEIRLSEQALDKLLEHDFKTARRALENATAYALMLYSGSYRDEIEILAPYLLFEAVEQQQADEPKIKTSVTVKSKKMRVAQYLDSLEVASVKLFEDGEALTGLAVGQTMETPVSAPAITEYLRKNERYITQLLDEHPDRWEIIRAHFRPLINVREKLRRRNTG
ncbi:MAG: hypothetical protein LBV41_01910 [Cytophagaceae bacterium]|jgi:hypothetical protein|nr:hypothetical protein [Cytophagaceae bacterium]